MGEQHSSVAERLLLSFAGVAAVYTDALVDYTHRVSESTRNFAVQSASAATPNEAREALVSYLAQQYSETVAFTAKLLNSEPLENDLPIERGCSAPGIKEAAS
jgi:hypothetical protein